MGYPDHPDYVWMMAAVVALDAFQAVPFCYLRYQRRPVKFAVLKLSFIALNILLNLLFFVVFPRFIDGWQIEVGHVFLVNLICTGLITFGFWKELFGVKWRVDVRSSAPCFPIRGPSWYSALRAFSTKQSTNPLSQTRSGA